MVITTQDFRARWQDTDKNARLGRLFVTVGCLCQALLLAGLMFGGGAAGLTATPVYLALALAGLALLFESQSLEAEQAVPMAEACQLTTEPAQAEAGLAAPACRFLLIGAENSFLTALRLALASERIATIDRIESPFEAVQQLIHLGDSDLPDAILLASVLPVFSPVDVLRSLQENSRLAPLPVVVCGDGLSGQEISRLYVQGATSVLGGQFSREYLDAFRTFCQSRHA